VAALTPAWLRARVLALADLPESADPPIAIAVSGGADSLALLLLAHAAFGPRTLAFTVDHGLRPEAATEAAHVARLCATLPCRHRVLTPGACAFDAGQSLQAAARALRYAALGAACREAGIALLLTAHHADDQAETLLMRLNRGSGLAGLAGVRPVARIAGLTVLRPLLGTRRTDLAALVRARGWVPVVDASNTDPRFDRTRARALLQARGGLDPLAAATSAALLAEAEAALDWATDRAWDSRVAEDPPGLRLDLSGLPAEIQRRLLARAAARLDRPARGRAIARLLLAGGGTLGALRLRRSSGDLWTISPARPRRAPARRPPP
jgi:tRNA(Ile)-lysidine synthase